MSKRRMFVDKGNINDFIAYVADKESMTKEDVMLQMWEAVTALDTIRHVCDKLWDSKQNTNLISRQFDFLYEDEIHSKH